MPKASRQRIRGHEQAIKPSNKRQYAVQDNQIERVEVGSAKQLSAPEILESMSSGPSIHLVRNALTKKAKQMTKHQIFLERLEASKSPYSKSHARRLKRKAKEQIGGGFSDIQAAIAEMEEDTPKLAQESTREAAVAGADAARVSANESRVRLNPGLVGEGKGAPLTTAQRKKAFQLEKKRHPMILRNAAFSANPFEVIRTHAQNTLLKHQPPVT